jgi:uncharacterized lipoprotein YajG
VNTSTITTLAALLILAGCASQPGSDRFAAARAACVAGDQAARATAGMHPQVHSDDAAVEASVNAALATVVTTGATMPDKPRSYAQIYRPDEHR